VDIGAIFRLAPGLMNAAPGVRGTVELTVSDARDGGAPASYSLTTSGDRVTIEEQQADSPDARVRGKTAAWIAALSPDHDRGGLHVTGDGKLADGVLDGLVASSERTPATVAA
jgi:hypothetical protein